jgi:hypothetical protein
MFADETNPPDKTTASESAASESSVADDSDAVSTGETTEKVEASTETAADDAAAFEMPPASFLMLIGMFSTQAMVCMGVIPNPATGKAESQLPLARHFIDLLEVLAEKTKGNLDTEEQTQLDGTLHQLRMVYVEQNRAASGKASTEK